MLSVTNVLLYVLLPLCGLAALFLRRPSKTLLGKHVLVTGGSLGIGKAVAILAAQKGAHVTIVARNEDTLRESAEEIRRHLRSADQKVQHVSADIASQDVDVISAKLEEATRRLGPVFMLVNCAGTSVTGKFEDIPPKEFYRLMDVNYFGGVNVTRAILPQMKAEGGGGCIIFVSSIAGLVGLYGFTAYTATKFAVRGFAEALEMELKPFNIDVSVSFPPDTDTPGFAEEQKGKPEETKMISESAGLFQPEAVAKSIIDDALKGHFFSSVGLDGWMITTISAGMADSSIEKLLIQVLFIGPLRLVAWCYRKYFNSIVMKCKKKREAGKREN